MEIRVNFFFLWGGGGGGERGRGMVVLQKNEKSVRPLHAMGERGF